MKTKYMCEECGNDYESQSEAERCEAKCKRIKSYPYIAVVEYREVDPRRDVQDVSIYENCSVTMKDKLTLSQKTNLLGRSERGKRGIIVRGAVDKQLRAFYLSKYTEDSYLEVVPATKEHAIMALSNLFTHGEGVIKETNKRLRSMKLWMNKVGYKLPEESE